MTVVHLEDPWGTYVLKESATPSAVGFDARGRLVVGGFRGLKIWDLEAGVEAAFLPHGDAVGWVGTAAGGLRAASVRGGEVKLWDLAAGRAVKTAGISDTWFALALSGDGRILAEARSDHTVALHDLQAGQEIARIRGHKKPVRALALSASGDRLLTGSEDKTLGLWSIPGGERLQTLGAGAGREKFSASREPVRAQGAGLVTAVALMPDGRHALSVSWDDRTVKLWNLESGERVAAMPGHRAGVAAVTAAPAGLLAASGGEDHAVIVWDCAARKALHVLKGHQSPVQVVAFRPDGRTLVSIDADFEIRCWDAASGALLAVRQGGPQPICALAVTPDRSRVLSAGKGGAICVWDALDGTLIGKLEGCDLPGRESVEARDDFTLTSSPPLRSSSGWTGALPPSPKDIVYALAVSTDGRRAVSAGADGMVRSWDLRGLALLQALDAGQPLAGAAFTDDGRLWTAGRKAFQLWDLAAGKVVRSIKVPAPRPGWSLTSTEPRALQSTVAAFCGSLAVSASTRETLVRMWDLRTGKAVLTLDDDEGSVAVAVSADGTMAATGGDDRFVIWDLTRGRRRHVLAQEGFVNALAFSPDSRLLMAGSHDATIRAWTVSDGREVSRASLDGFDDTPYSVAFTGEGRAVVGTWRGVLFPV